MTPDTLARLRIRAESRTWRRRLDDDGAGVTVTLPHPRDLAESLGSLSSRTLYRTGSAGVVREDGSPVALQDVAAALVRSWAALPDRDDAGEVYGSLRLLATISPKRSALEYALDVARGWRLSLPRPPRPKRDAPRPAPKTTGERVSAHRERVREEEAESARWWLDGYLSGWGDAAEAPSPDAEVLATVLYRLARERLEDVVEEYGEDVTDPAVGSPSWLLSLAERLEEWTERAEDEDLPVRPRVPGSRRFYGVADEVLGDSREIRSRQRVYTIPDPTGGTMPKTNTHNRDAFAEAVLDRVARLVLEDRADDLASYLEDAVRERDRREEATGTDGAVVDLDSRRRSR